MSDTVLIVDDDSSMCAMLEHGLGTVGHTTVSRTTAVDALALLHERDIAVIVTDIRMGGMTGLEFCKQVAENRPDIPVVVITAFGSMETAVAAIRAGAYDFLTKPFDLDTLRLTVKRAAQHRSLTKRIERLQQALRETRVFENMLGTSPALRRVYDLIERAAPTDAAVLITGESGTGKELIARALHQRSRRSRGPFVAVNCAAMPETLLESELFGHLKGAYTDARTERRGLFQDARGGTLFLDEIGELPLSLQPKLLRALQERAVRPVGGSAEVPFDARVITASNRDLEAAVEERRFRDDLYYRIQVIQIESPPLRVRGNDVLLLAQHFVEHFAAVNGSEVAGILPAAAERLLTYPWPGNVRELQNCIERAVALCRYRDITVEDLPDKIRSYQRAQPLLTSSDPAELVPMEEIERRYVLRVFETLGHNKSLTAKTLGFNRKTLYRKLRRYGVILPETGADDSD